MRPSILWIVIPTVALAVQANYGTFIGTVHTESLEDGRRMRLTAPFAYVDPQGKTWRAAAGDTVDGASVPTVAWSLIGGPFEGRYRSASVIHDVSCDRQVGPWEEVHEMFFWALLASGVERWRAKVMYGAVYHFGPRWPRVVTVSGMPRTEPQIARDIALQRAAAGSTAEVIGISTSEVRPTFSVRVTPPEVRPSEEAFKRMEAEIARRDSSTAGGLSLDEIRRYQPR